MMWIVFTRAPAPDAAYWPGRRALAALEALAWPVIALVLLSQVQGRAGLLAPVACVICGINALARLRTALWENHRYRFATWRVGRVVVVLVLIGAALKVGIAWR